MRNNLSEVDVFKLIDQFYGKRKLISFEQIVKNNGPKDHNKEKDKKKEKGLKKNKDSDNDSITEETDLKNDYAFNIK